IPTPHYKQGEWNTLRVRIEKDGVKCFLNEQLVLESTDAEWAEWAGGQIGLAKFRETKAEFKNFRVGPSLPPTAGDGKAVLKRIETKASAESLAKLAKEKNSTNVIRARAQELEKQAAELKQLAARVHQQRVYDELVRVLDAKEEKIDLIHAALLLAKLDN